MKTKPEIIEVFADNGGFSHYTLIDSDTGGKLWSESPEECKAMGYPVETSSDKVTEGVEVKQIRNNFFAECTNSYEGIPKVSLHPHNLFEWFKPYLQRGIQTNVDDFFPLKEGVTNYLYNDKQKLKREVVKEFLNNK